MPELERQLIKIVRNESWLMDALRIARSLQLPDWYIAAGAIRNTVWNVLHGLPGIFHLKDIDVVYFDIADLEGKKEQLLKTTLQKMNPSFLWDIVNQARIHKSSYPKITSSAQSLAYWSETCTCVGVRLEEDDSITVCAPHGLDDLFQGIVRPIPQPYQDLELYTRRMQEKQWQKIWQKLTIIS